jgi:hypothetical protein
VRQETIPAELTDTPNKSPCLVSEKPDVCDEKLYEMENRKVKIRENTSNEELRGKSTGPQPSGQWEGGGKTNTPTRAQHFFLSGASGRMIASEIISTN